MRTVNLLLPIPDFLNVLFGSMHIFNDSLHAFDHFDNLIFLAPLAAFHFFDLNI